MRALVIGAAGFVGGYLIQHLQNDCSWEVYATKLSNETLQVENRNIYDLDILQYDQVCEVLDIIKPDVIFHLAAQSSVALAWKNPNLTVDVNIKGCLNVLEAVKTLNYRPRVLLIGSGEEYGRVKESEVPIREENALRPGNIYAVTKACQNMIGKLYVDAYSMDIMMVRAFNHFGPKQAPMFVVSDFCKQVAEIEKGMREPVIYVGNLSAKRDFCDVRDVVRAYRLLMEKGTAGETYNVGSGHAIEIQSLLDTILSNSESKIDVKVDQEKLRPIDVPIIQADTHKIRKDTGWEQIISIEQTIKDTLLYWRNVL